MIKFTKQAWIQYLVRGRHDYADKFLDLMATIMGNTSALDSMIKDLHNSKDLLNRVKVFHFDLMNYSCNLPSQNRLESFRGEYFMSEVCFNRVPTSR